MYWLNLQVTADFRSLYSKYDAWTIHVDIDYSLPGKSHELMLFFQVILLDLAEYFIKDIGGPTPITLIFSQGTVSKPLVIFHPYPFHYRNVYISLKIRMSIIYIIYLPILILSIEFKFSFITGHSIWVRSKLN